MRVAQKAAEGDGGGGGAVSFHHRQSLFGVSGEKPLKMVWLFNIPKTKTAHNNIHKDNIDSLTKHANSEPTHFSWLIYRLLAEYNTTWSRISHPAAVVVSRLELWRNIYSCEYYPRTEV